MSRPIAWLGMHKLVLPALPLLLCAGCGSHAQPTRSAQTIASCLQRTQTTTVAAQRITPPRSARPGPKPTFVVTGADGGEVLVYATAKAAQSRFDALRLDGPSATSGNVVAIYSPSSGGSIRARRTLFRCAFGPKVTPKLNTAWPPRTGRQVFLDAGCLACHRLGAAGNNGPGPNLTDVGRRLTPQAIARVLTSPAPPMPSFRAMPRMQFRALINYLHQLRGAPG